jgi:hypothetical protein
MVQASEGQFTIKPTKFAGYRFEAQMRTETGSIRRAYFGKQGLSTYLDTHQKSLRESYMRANHHVIQQALDVGDLFCTPILEWKILYNKERMSDSLRDYINFIRNNKTNSISFE